MESALSPREIQTRIRSGESVDDLARVAGIDRDRVERFAAPVIAEREHVAGLAMASSARRRGETSTHRTLRGVLQERLLSRGVDSATVRWDSYRVDDGRWAVTADYQSGETPRQALFYFDVPGRFSVAGNDEGRWVLGDSSTSRGPQPGGPPVSGQSDDDTEPTVDLSDELALVRAIQDVPVVPSPEPSVAEESEVAEVVHLNRVFDEQAQSEASPEFDEWADDEEPANGDESAETSEAEVSLEGEPEEPDEPEERVVGLPVIPDPEAAEPTVELGRLVQSGARSSPSDASAVPELSAPLQPDAWEPAIVVDYPVEPSEDTGAAIIDGIEVPEGSDDPGRPEAAVAEDDRWDEAAALEDAPQAGGPEPEDRPEAEPAVEGHAAQEQAAQGQESPAQAAHAQQEPAAEAEADDPALPIDVPASSSPTTPRPSRRKRAAVPSWDEIVFGGPKEK